jgi:PAS domain S-box-containing protein
MTTAVPTIEVLLIEDNPEDVALVRQALADQPFTDFRISHSKDLASGLIRLKEDHYDVVLLDVLLSGNDLVDVVSKVRESAQVPVVILTRLDDKDKALQAVRAGAQDYLVKGRVSDESLCRVLSYAVERRRFEEQILASSGQAAEAEANLELALRASRIGLWFVEIGTDKITWNHNAQVIYGMDPGLQQATFKEFLSWIHPDDRERARLAAKMSFENVGDYDFEYRIVRPDGSTRNIVSKGRTFFDSSGKPVRMAGACADITKHKLAEVNENRLAMLEEREEFMATLTHDLKNPLLGIGRVLELMSGERLGPLTADQKNALRQLGGATNRTLSIIQNLMEVYRFEREDQSVAFEETELLEILRSSVQSALTIAEDRRVEINTEFPNHAVKLKGDSNAIHRLMLNLLDNAVKFTAGDGKISVRVIEKVSTVVIEIQDSGVGIAIADQKCLFQRFKQGIAGKNFRPGSGLGLYLCKQIVDAHMGRIDFESSEGLGTTFRVELPAVGRKGHQLQLQS